MELFFSFFIFALQKHIKNDFEKKRNNKYLVEATPFIHQHLSAQHYFVSLAHYYVDRPFSLCLSFSRSMCNQMNSGVQLKKLKMNQILGLCCCEIIHILIVHLMCIIKHINAKFHVEFPCTKEISCVFVCNCCHKSLC